MRLHKHPYLLLPGIFKILNLVPIIFAAILLGLSEYTSSIGSPAKSSIVLLIIGFVFLAVWIFFGVFTQALLIGGLAQIHENNAGPLNMFKEMRRLYWRTFMYSILAATTFVPALIILLLGLISVLTPALALLLTIIWVLIDLVFIMRGPGYLPREPAWKALASSVNSVFTDTKKHFRILSAVWGTATILFVISTIVYRLLFPEGQFLAHIGVSIIDTLGVVITTQVPFVYSSNMPSFGLMMLLYLLSVVYWLVALDIIIPASKAKMKSSVSRRGRSGRPALSRRSTTK